MAETQAWSLVLAAGRGAEERRRADQPAAFAIDAEGALTAARPDGDTAILAWQPRQGWRALLPADDPRRPSLDLYLPIASATPDRPIVIGHLGQSLDGFIATHAGESRFITGQQNILHLHRLRALCDAVVVGAGTVAADDPQLTTRLVSGPSPVRVVLDPARRLDATHRIFHDDQAETIYVCGRSHLRAGETRWGHASVVAIAEHPDGSGRVNAPAVVAMLRARGCHRIFVEGGGVTVSAFLEAGALDRLHVAIAPLIIGDGRPAIRLPARVLLGDCQRPRYRVFRLGGDVLFDCDLAAGDATAPRHELTDAAPVARII